MQIGSKARDDVNVIEEDLLKIPQGPRTEACLRHNCVVGVQYLEAWLGGLGCVPLYNLMEDAATAEICRTQARPTPSAFSCLDICLLLLQLDSCARQCMSAAPSVLDLVGRWVEQAQTYQIAQNVLALPGCHFSSPGEKACHEFY